MGSQVAVESGHLTSGGHPAHTSNVQPDCERLKRGKHHRRRHVHSDCTTNHQSSYVSSQGSRTPDTAIDIEGLCVHSSAKASSTNSHHPQHQTHGIGTGQLTGHHIQRSSRRRPGYSHRRLQRIHFQSASCVAPNCHPWSAPVPTHNNACLMHCSKSKLKEMRSAKAAASFASNGILAHSAV